MKTICIMCPVGCELNIIEKDKDIVVTGNSCPRGEVYGRQEYLEPKRIVTSLIRTNKGVVSVKTTNPVPKELIAKVLLEISKIKLKNPKYNEIVIKNVLNTDADIITTSEN